MTIKEIAVRSDRLRVIPAPNSNDGISSREKKPKILDPARELSTIRASGDSFANSKLHPATTGIASDSIPDLKIHKQAIERATMGNKEPLLRINEDTCSSLFGRLSFQFVAGSYYFCRNPADHGIRWHIPVHSAVWGNH